ncbi:flagellar assembly protein FliH [Oceanobacillus picturae]|uniref:Flagellar assembly protein FliH n=1 Tax=Oceanobacillus picturae TaxID=171693 RepID=A0A0U9H7T5_9BACI|nr:hypothetical protein [Oceanobacillus picturae]GAQ18048.1 flagellar assembly protein FliH [Oceanobacillus picturae]
MKILTNNQYEQLLDKAYQRGHGKGKAEGYDMGYNQGLHDGLTREKEGVHINSNGMYHFKDGKSKAVTRLVTNES